MNNERSKRIYTTIMLIIVVALVTFIMTTVFIYKKIGNVSGYTNVYTNVMGSEFLRKVYALKQIINSEYISEIDEKDLIDGAIKGYVEGLGDDYTQYFTKEEMEEFLTETEGSYVGIGIYMYQNTKDNTVAVLTPLEGSPAEKAGILPGDIIKKVDDVEYTGEDFDKIASYIKGREGTYVKLEIERDGKVLTFNVERKSIDLYPIKSEILENNIGYINITSFDENTGKEFKNVYNKLNKNSIKGLIIDLRNNGGGIVDEALEIADYILEKDATILITKDKQGNEEIERSTNKPIVEVPICILVNGNTASASEILAAAIKENDKGAILGQKTFGKGVIQELISLSDGSGIKITTEEYYTPKRNKINEVGIIPDKEVSLPETLASSYNVEKEQDTQLKEAIKVLENT